MEYGYVIEITKQCDYAPKAGQNSQLEWMS